MKQKLVLIGGVIGLLTISMAGPPPNRVVVQTTYPIFYPAVAKDSRQNLYLAFEIATQPDNYDVVMYKSQDGGESWVGVWSELLNRPPNNRRPGLDVGPGDVIYLMAEGGGIGDIGDNFWWAKFPPGGAARAGYSTVGESGWYMKCSHPHVAFLQQGAWLLWEDDNVPDNPDINGTFAVVDTNVILNPEEVNLVRDITPDRYPFAVPIGPNSILLFYEHLGNDWDIHAKRVDITYNPTSQPPFTLNIGMSLSIATQSGDETQPYACVSGNYVYVVYNRENDIWLAYSTDGGSTFENVEVSAEPAKEGWPAVAADGKIVDIAYWSEDGNIYERCSEDNGQTFSKPALITSKPTALDTPRLAMIMGKEKPCIIWVDNRKGHPLLYSAVGYKTSSDFPSGETERLSEPSTDFLRVHPKLFNATTEIEYSLSEDMRVDLSVYGLTGRRVLTLIDRDESPGIHRLVWDGRDSKGVELPSGVYFICLRTLKGIYTQRVVLIR